MNNEKETAPITIDEIRKAKLELQYKISYLLSEFTNKYEIDIEGISISAPASYFPNKYDRYNCECNIEIIL